jgi:hypothetical protein
LKNQARRNFVEGHQKSGPHFHPTDAEGEKNLPALTMSIRINTEGMMLNQKHRQLWIGLAEIRPLSGGSEMLEGTKGAFVNIITWASNAEEFRSNAEMVIGNLGGLFIAEVISPEPVDLRRNNSNGNFDEEMEEMISRAEANPNAIMYGTFHLFERDDA